MKEEFDGSSSASEVEVTARGASLAEVFARSALGMFGLIIDPASVEQVEVREVRAHAATIERLLVSWLNECLYVHEVEGFVPCRVEVSPIDSVARPGGEPFRVHGLLYGEEMDPGRHVPRIAVKAALPEGARVSAGAEIEARVLFQT